MRVLITGASGFLGTALSRALVQRGDDVVAARRRVDPESVKWSTAEGFDPPEALSGFDAVIHLAGENVGAGRWTAQRKERIRKSRVEGTARVVEALRVADPRPTTLICASAVGYYGDTGQRTCTEQDEPGDDFLAHVCVAWEAEAIKAEELGVRVIRTRFGALLGSEGGMLERLLPVFKKGLGGRLGDGEQGISWIHLHDAVRAVLFLLDRSQSSGPYNVTAPEPASNREFTQMLGAVLHRPTVLPAPAFALRVAFGEMGDTVLLRGQRALPKRLLQEGFSFEYSRLQPALTDLVHRA